VHTLLQQSEDLLSKGQFPGREQVLSRVYDVLSATSIESADYPPMVRAVAALFVRRGEELRAMEVYRTALDRASTLQEDATVRIRLRWDFTGELRKMERGLSRSMLWSR